MTPLVTWTRGDTRALWLVTLQDASNNNAAIDLTGYTIKLRVMPNEGGNAVEVTGTDAGFTLGKVQFDCTTIAALTTSLVRGQIVLTDGSAKVQRSPVFFHAIENAI